MALILLLTRVCVLLNQWKLVRSQTRNSSEVLLGPPQEWGAKQGAVFLAYCSSGSTLVPYMK